MTTTDTMIPTGAPASVGAGDPDFEERTDRIIEKAAVLIPTLRARAQEAEELRYQPPQTVVDAEFLMDILTPRVWGGQGLGSRALSEVARVLAHGDVSAAWTLAFLIEHSWMAAHLPWKAQEEIFKESSFVLASAPLTPAGKAEKVDGGYRVTGTFRYASGLWNSTHTFASAMVTVDGVMTAMTFFVPLAQESVTVNDDWFMSGMAATGSASVSMDDVFVPEHFAIPLDDLISMDSHPGIVHEEKFLRYPPYASLGMMITGIALGAAESVVDIVKQRFGTTRAFGGATRQDLPQSRMRFAQAWEKLRMAQLLYYKILEDSIRKCDAMEPWSQQEIGQLELDQTTIVHIAQELIGILCDGMGSSPYQTKDPLQRYRRDIDVIANHAFMDWDLVGERSIRYVLGLGSRSTDVFRNQIVQGDAAKQRSGGGTDKKETTMKAAVLQEVAGVPVIGEFDAPDAGPGEEVVDVIVAALNPIDLRLAAGGPFGPPVIPSVVGTEGVGRLADGTKVYFSDPKAPYGALGAKVLLGERSRYYAIPEGLDDGLAAALGTSGVTALTALQWRAQLRAGDEVLVVGATGAAGQIGVQAAKLLGASRVVGAGRDVATLEKLKSAGKIDDFVVLTGEDEDAAAIKAAAHVGYDVVLDAVMGPAFSAALPATKIGARYVVIGMSGGQPATTIAYPFLTGRSVFGHLKPLVPVDEWEAAYQQLVGWANAGQLDLEVERIPFSGLVEAWPTIAAGQHKKLVVEL